MGVAQKSEKALSTVLAWMALPGETWPAGHGLVKAPPPVPPSAASHETAPTVAW